MIEFSVNDRKRSDVPCGYPKSFRLIGLTHNVKDVFYTNDVYDRFIAIGKGISYSDNFINGYWHRSAFLPTEEQNAIYDLPSAVEFVSGCHLDAVDIQTNIVICDDGTYWYSEDGSVWHNGKRFCSEAYMSGWNCICSGPNEVIIVNNTYKRSDGIANGVGVYGAWNNETQQFEWTEISLPFPANSVKFFNGYFYIYGEVESTNLIIDLLGDGVDSSVQESTLEKTFYASCGTGESEFFIVETGGFGVSPNVRLYDPSSGEQITNFTSSVNEEVLTIKLETAVQEETIYKVKYDVLASECTFVFTTEEEVSIDNITVRATINGAVYAPHIESVSVDDNIITLVIKCEHFDDVTAIEASIYSTSSNIADIEQSAISDNGINFCTNENYFESGEGEFICDAAYGRGIYIAVTTEGGAVCSTQTPSRNWKSIDGLVEKGCRWNGVAFVCGVFVVCGVSDSNEYKLYYSYNLEEWTETDFSAVNSTDLSDFTAYPLKLIDCEGTLVATSLTPELSGNDIEIVSTKGFFACDTYISIDENTPLSIASYSGGEQAMNYNGGESTEPYKKMILRMSAIEESIRSLQNILGSGTFHSQYKGDISTQAQFDTVTKSRLSVGDIYNLVCPINYKQKIVLSQSDFCKLSYGENESESWNENNLIKCDEENTWKIEWEPNNILNTLKTNSMITAALKHSCTVYNNASVVMTGIVTATDIENGMLKIQVSDKYSTLSDSISWTSIKVNAIIETCLPIGVNIMWNGIEWDNISQSNNMSNYTTVQQVTKMLAHGISNIYNNIEQKYIQHKEVQNMTDSVAILQHNRYYKWGVVESLNISLADNDTSYMYEYCFEFVSGDTPAVLNLPDNIRYSSGNNIEAGKKYLVNIFNDTAVISVVTEVDA